MATIKIISQEFVKPSSPTPSNLRTFRLSLLDQLIPAPYGPMVLYYPIGGATHTQVLKESLSEALTHFYPLAGTIKDDLSIECNDVGAYFATAKVDCYLYEFLGKPDLGLINGFLPCDPFVNESMAGKNVTNIQLNLFECGGIAIGLCISHKILDGAGLKAFLISWAGKTAGEQNPTCLSFSASSLFPANDLWLKDSSMAIWSSAFRKGVSVTKRIVFNGDAITNLKQLAATPNSNFRPPTRVEAVSAFLWKCINSASSQLNFTRKASVMTHIVNLRRRSMPPLPENTLGNLIWITGARCDAYQNVDFPALTDKIRISISKINGEYIKELSGRKGSALMRKSLKELEDFGSQEEVDHLGFSSWCGFGYYEIDFGFGKPTWISSISVSATVFMNLVILVDSKYGDGGIEAWVTLDKGQMCALENNQELLAFASVDPGLGRQS